MMVASGNMKKGIDPLVLKKGLYTSLEDSKEEREKPKKSRQQDAKEAKERLMDRFNLS